MFNLSCVLILPAALQSAGNALSIVLGHGPDTYSVPLCTGETVTHYGAHAWVQPEFIATIQAASQGALPASLTTLDEEGDPPISPADLAAILSGLILSVREGGDPHEHWQETLVANGLIVQQVEFPV
jgi:hypothetical protein